MVIAYSYIRFSSPKQAEGDSLRRQTQEAQAYCDRQGWTLDTTLTLRDLGVSAWKGRNAAVGNLRTFLDAITAKRILPGSVLIVESLDRITRQGIDEGYDVIKDILKAGVLIVTLLPPREFNASAIKALAKGALEIQLILERAAEESERKSERVGAAWARKKRQDAAKGTLITRRLPAWVRLVDGRLVLDEAKAQAIRQVYLMSIGGYGDLAIAMKLDEEGVPPISGSERWNQSYVWSLLNERKVLGEYQPMKGRGGERKPDGPPHKGYFPAVIDEELWHAARGAAALRKGRPSRSGKKNCVRIFSGLLRDAGDGRLIRVVNKGIGKAGGPRLAPRSGKYITFPLDAFEKAIREKLREIDPRELLPKTDGGPAARVLALSNQLAEREAEMEKVKARLERKYSDAVADVLDRHEEAVAALRLELAQARQEAAAPVAEAWGELRSLNDVPDTEEGRMRLRAALRRVVEAIYCLFAGRGRERLAAVRIAFKDGGTRRYAIRCKPGEPLKVLSLRDDEQTDPLHMSEEAWALGAATLDVLIASHE